MAHVVLTAVVSTTLNQLTSPALQEILLLYNCKKELRRLKATTEAIGNVLQDAEERQAKEHLVLGWLDRLKVVMYDADDLLDRVRFRALRKKGMRGSSVLKEVRFFLYESNHVRFVFGTAHRVKEIRKALDHVTEDMRGLNFIPHRREDARCERIRGEETYSFVREDVVFGREEERASVISMLLLQVEGESSSREVVGPGSLSVVTIIGFGGLGKTTLAKLVYNDELVKRKFDLRLWVCINYLTNMTQVLKAIIESSGRVPVNSGFDQLRRQLTGIVSGKKLLLVMDNVWEEDRSTWVDLKATLDGCNINGSRILATTRSKVVAEKAEALKPYYELGALLEESAWSLFVKMAFTDVWELETDPDLEPLGRQVVRKCGCVPLALITIGGLLRRKEKRWWLHYIDSQLPEVVRYNENRMAQALRISYDDLPSNLKLCFVYCSLFPKDYLFEKDKLARLWLAQGFIKSDSNIGVGGENSFLYLLERCFFQEVQVVDAHGSRRYMCKMHDLLHDLATEVAGEEYLVFEEVVPGLEEKATRHMAFDCELDALDEYPDMFDSSRALRTLICSSKAIGAYSLSKSFRMLRALDISRTKLAVIPKSIGELIQMRYLNLSDNEDLVSLPDSICNLLYLQTLILSWCRSLVKLPSKVGKLTRLSCLLLNECINLTYLPPGISALTSLVSLDRLMVHEKHGGLSYLDRLNKLRGSLTIELPTKRWEKVIEDASKSNFSKKQYLNGLVLAWRQSEINGDQRLSIEEVDQVLEALKPHENLEYLKITKCGASKLPTWLSSHQNIKELNLECWHEMRYMEDTITSSSLFRRLETLAINDMDNLEGWWPANEEGQSTRVPCFPRVKTVYINRCPNLKQRMPLFNQIEELTLGHVDSEAVRQLLTVSMNGSNRLRKLKLESIEGLKHLFDDWILHLTTLETFEITSCKELIWVSINGLKHLTALEELRFEECGKVQLVDDQCEMEDEEGLPWEYLKKLRVLKLPMWEMHFAYGIIHLTELEDLAIYNWQEKEEEEEAIREMYFPYEAQNLTDFVGLGIINSQMCDDDYEDKEGEEESGEVHLHNEAQNLTELEEEDEEEKREDEGGRGEAEEEGRIGKFKEKEGGRWEVEKEEGRRGDVEEEEGEKRDVEEEEGRRREVEEEEEEERGQAEDEEGERGNVEEEEGGRGEVEEEEEGERGESEEEAIGEMYFPYEAQNLTDLVELGIINFQMWDDDYEDEDVEEEIGEVHLPNEAQNLTELEEEEEENEENGGGRWEAEEEEGGGRGEVEEEGRIGEFKEEEGCRGEVEKEEERRGDVEEEDGERGDVEEEEGKREKVEEEEGGRGEAEDEEGGRGKVEEGEGERGESEEEAIGEMYFSCESQNLTDLVELGIINFQMWDDDYEDEDEEGEIGEVHLPNEAQNLTKLEEKGEGEEEGGRREAEEEEEEEGGRGEAEEDEGGREEVEEKEEGEKEGGRGEGDDEEGGRGEGEDEDGGKGEVEEEEGGRGETGGEEAPCSWRHLTKLRKLTVGFNQKSCRFPQQFQHLDFLEHLVITDCRRLSAIWTTIATLKQLQSLTFHRVENVIQEDFTGPPHSLTKLKFDECQGELEWMEQIPWDSLTSLHSLALVDMPNLESLPQGIQNLNSLQELTIIKCQNLPSLPDWINKLTSLRSLVIAICSEELNDSCNRQPTVDQIRLIPHLNIF